MSKAFTREDEGGDDVAPDDAPALPDGVKNYMTPDGFRRLRDELEILARVEAAGNRRDGVMGGRQRRPLGKWRLHLW